MSLSGGDYNFGSTSQIDKRDLLALNQCYGPCMQKHFALLGASRGLGWATYQEIKAKYKDSHFFLSSRKIEARVSEISQTTKLTPQDFSKIPLEGTFLQQLQQFNPTDLIYFAGGGPYGNFADKKWKDHLWSLNTTFFYPAELLHHILSEKEKWPCLQKIIFIGSAIAESKPDPQAASYAAAKHALKGLISTVQTEEKQISIELFSPGYMQTDLLPSHSEPRQKQMAENPMNVAKKLVAVIEKND